MKNLGSLLVNAREKSGTSREEVAKKTKIKEKFLVALEESDWTVLPNFSVARGFTKTYAEVLGVNPDLAVALLRRDFPFSSSTLPRGGVVTAMQETSLSSRAIWTPKATIIGVFVLVIAVLGFYLFRQYRMFAAAPPVTVDVVVQDNKIKVSGKTLPSATVTIERQTVLVDSEGKFEFVDNIEVVGDTVEVKAVSRAGKITIVSREVVK